MSWFSRWRRKITYVPMVNVSWPGPWPNGIGTVELDGVPYGLPVPWGYYRKYITADCSCGNYHWSRRVRGIIPNWLYGKACCGHDVMIYWKRTAPDRFTVSWHDIWRLFWYNTGMAYNHWVASGKRYSWRRSLYARYLRAWRCIMLRVTKNIHK